MVLNSVSRECGQRWPFAYAALRRLKE